MKWENKGLSGGFLQAFFILNFRFAILSGSSGINTFGGLLFTSSLHNFLFYWTTLLQSHSVNILGVRIHISLLF